MNLLSYLIILLGLWDGPQATATSGGDELDAPAVITERWGMPFAKAFVLSAGRYCLHPPQGTITTDGEIVTATGPEACVDQLQQFALTWAHQFEVDIVTLEGSPERLARYRSFVEDHHSHEEAQIASNTSACTCMALFGSHAASLAEVYHKTHNNVARGQKKKPRQNSIMELPGGQPQKMPGLIWQWQRPEAEMPAPPGT